MTDNPKDINEQLEELKRTYVKGLGAKIEEVGAVAGARAKTACEALLEQPSMDRWRSIEGYLEELRNAVNGALDIG